MGVGGIVGDEHLGDAVERGGLADDRIDAVPDDEHVDRASERPSGGQRLRRGVAELAAGDRGQEQDRHASTPASESLATSSVTLPSLEPAWRTAGSLVFSTSSRGVTSTPHASGLVSAIGFFLAFMMLGSEA